MRQITEQVIISVFTGIKGFLSSFALSERCPQIFLIITHFRVIRFVSDMKPSLPGQIYDISVSVADSPAYVLMLP